jgi:hypothetical protein
VDRTCGQDGILARLEKNLKPSMTRKKKSGKISGMVNRQKMLEHE